MLPLALTADEERFRQEVCAWLAEHLVGEFRDAAVRGAAASEEGFELRVRWEKELAGGGWLGLGFPQEYGGRGATIAEQIVFAYESALAGAPYRMSVQGTDMLGPALVAFGTEAQKRRFLPGILSADVVWCQGFSEPEAGSDLAGVRTTATRDGDQWVVHGQKMWTTFAHHADWIYVLCRTNAEAPKHGGLSLLLVPMRQPGIDVRRIKNLVGSAEFCEVFFDGARTDADLVLGPVDGGWKVAGSVLGFERGTATLPHQLQFERELDELFAVAHDRGRTLDPVVRGRLTDAWIRLRILGLNNMRKLTGLLQDGVLGPEASIGKVYWSEWHQLLCELELDVLGAEATLCQYDESPSEAMQRMFLLSRAETIYGGANEIQRNSLGERVLGLPREPR